MAAITSPIPPHLRKIHGKMARVSPSAAPLPFESVTPLTVVYGNVVGDETIRKPEAQPVGIETAEAWWVQLSNADKIGIAEPYILEGRELPSATTRQTVVPTLVAPITSHDELSVRKPDVKPNIPISNMEALRELLPNVSSTVDSSNEWDAPSARVSKDDWNTPDSPPKKVVKPTSTRDDNEWDVSFTPTRNDDLDAPPASQKRPSSTSRKHDDWTASSPQPAQRALISFNQGPSSERMTTTTNRANSEGLADETRPAVPIDGDADQTIPPRKPGWIGMRSNGADQDEFIRVSLL